MTPNDRDLAPHSSPPSDPLLVLNPSLVAPSATHLATSLVAPSAAHRATSLGNPRVAPPIAPSRHSGRPAPVPPLVDPAAALDPPRLTFLTALLTALLACSPPQPSPRTAATRIASQTVLSDELLWDLGDSVRERIVALSPLADDPLYSAVAHRWPPAIPRLPGTSEALLARDPDLVIIASFTAPETRAFLEAHGVATLVLERFADFDDLRANTHALATAVGAPAAGDALCAGYDARLAALARDRPRGRPLLALAWSDGIVAGAGTSFDAIATAAGLRNMAAEQGLSGHSALSLEQVVAWDPEVLVIACEPLGCDAAERELAARSGLAATRAAREGGVFAVPARHLGSTGAGMLDAAERLQARRLARTDLP